MRDHHTLKGDVPMETITITRDRLVFGPYITDLTESIRDRAESGEDEPTVWAAGPWGYLTLGGPVDMNPTAIADALSQPFGAVVLWEDPDTYRVQLYRAETWPLLASEREVLDYTRDQDGVILDGDGMVFARFDGGDIPAGPQVKADNLTPLDPNYRLTRYTHYYVGADNQLYEVDPYESPQFDLYTWDVNPDTGEAWERNLATGVPQLGVSGRDSQSFNDCEYVTAQTVCSQHYPGTFVKAVPTNWAQSVEDEDLEGWTLLTDKI